MHSVCVHDTLYVHIVIYTVCTLHVHIYAVCTYTCNVCTYTLYVHKLYVHIHALYVHIRALYVHIHCMYISPASKKYTILESLHKFIALLSGSLQGWILTAPASILLLASSLSAGQLTQPPKVCLLVGALLLEVAMYRIRFAAAVHLQLHSSIIVSVPTSSGTTPLSVLQEFPTAISMCLLADQTIMIAIMLGMNGLL